MLNHYKVIVLAAGKGTRLNCTKDSKVMRLLASKPMIGYTADLLKRLGFRKDDIYFVVGFGRKGLRQYLGKEYHYVWQKDLLGTAHAVKIALQAVPSNIENILVVQGDDTAFYPREEIIRLLADHRIQGNDLTFLTVEKANPNACGRILRNRYGQLTGIVEVKNASSKHLKIKEINAAVYAIKTVFASEFLPKIKKNPISGEYYLPDLINLGLKQGRRIMAIKTSDNDYFQSVNTTDELKKADWLMKQKTKLTADSNINRDKA
jgi:bifunctional UDP-N-acetylglucosamine pyrophosphorylase/glucosamine-1-phosphate N-acetyltransferase